MKKGIKSKLALLLVLALCVTTMPLNVTASQIEDEAAVTEGTSEEATTEEVVNEEESGIEDAAGLEENGVAELPDEGDMEDATETAGIINDLTEESEPIIGAGETLEINENNFPDAEFRRYLKKKFDRDGNNKLDPGSIEEICVDSYNIQNLKGIELFPNLKVLICPSQNISTLDVTQNRVLEELVCGGTNISTLDVTQNSALKELFCSDTKISTLDVTKNSALEKLHCAGTNISTLDVTKNSALKYLNCDITNISTLDVTKNSALEELHCGGTNISTLDVTQNRVLEGLYCGGTKISTLDVTQNSVLELLECFETKISTLDVTKNSALVYLHCSDTNISTLDVTKNSVLGFLDCWDTNISTLDVTKNSALEELNCSGTKISTLDVTKNSALVLLDCSDTNIGSIDASKLEALKYLDCDADSCVTMPANMDHHVSVRIYYNGTTSSKVSMANISGLTFKDKKGAYNASENTIDLSKLTCSYISAGEWDDRYAYNLYAWDSDDNGTYCSFEFVVIQLNKVAVSYRTHVQSYGWQDYVSDGKMAGTSGKAKRLEGINISVKGNDNLGIQYTTHCQTYGWLPWSSNGEMNGTEKEAKRLEAIKIQLTGADKDKYNVYYRVHAQSYGWLGWAKNGEPAGTAGYGKRLEGIQILVLKKGETAPAASYGGIAQNNANAYIAKAGTSATVGGAASPNVAYKTHVQTYGWQGWKYNGQTSGTTGKAKRLEGINIKLTNKPFTGGIAYTTHVQTYGWQGDVNNPSTWKKDGDMAGTSGKAKRLEAICIKLTGEMEKHYDVYYRVHAQSYGWLGWAKNGEQSGTAGYAKRLEGIQIVLVPKGGMAPANNYGGVTSARSQAYVSKTGK